jgi:uncharacterized protein (DUF488 family)
MSRPRVTTIVSVGYEGRTLEELVRTLEQSKVDVLVDVRLTPISRKKGLSKTALSAALAEAGIDYRHAPELGNPKDNRDSFRKGLKSARARYEAHLSKGAEATFDATIALAKVSRIALLCFERDHSSCHRSSITERAQKSNPALSVLKV